MDSLLSAYLKKHDIPFEEHKHPAVFHVSDSLVLIPNAPYLRTKNLFLKDEEGRFYLICLPAEKRLDMNGLEEHLGVKKLKFGSPEELLNELGIRPGSVSLFSILNAKKTRLLIDREVWESKAAGFHPNENTSTLELSRSSIHKFCSTLPNKPEVY